MDDAVAENVAALVASVREEVSPLAKRITIDLQASGELPYRIERPDDVVPTVGLAYVPALPETTPSVPSSGALDVTEAR